MSHEKLLSNTEMIYRTLGRTGMRVSAIGLGGFHIGQVEDEAEAIRIIRVAVEHGITFMDNCWDYHDGVSEVRIGKFERYKTTNEHDRTVLHPWWMGAA